MSEHMLEHEVKMLNQIAANFAWESDADKAAAAVASHVQRFWTARMRRELLDAENRTPLDLSPLARQALAKLS